MKKYIIVIVIIGIILGFFTGIYLYKINKINTQKQKEIVAETVEDECTAIGKLDEQQLISLIEANNKEKKTSPNCILTLKIYYNTCGHLIEKKETIKETEVNMTEEQLKQKFNQWEVQRFTPTEIVLYKEVNEFCNEHYLLKEKNGYIAIYRLDENNNEELVEYTDISMDYLTEEDLKEIEKGIIIFTKRELNKTIEDFE